MVASAEDSGLAWKRSVSAAALATALPGLTDEVEFAAGVGVFGRGRAASAAALDGGGAGTWRSLPGPGIRMVLVAW